MASNAADRPVIGKSVRAQLRIQADHHLADLARAYCAAMHANRDAPDEWTALAAVNRTYYDLMKACGYYQQDDESDL